MAGGVFVQVTDGDNSIPTEGSKAYAIIVCVFASLGGIFFGYDQGVTGGVIVMDSFLRDFCVGYDGNTMTDCTSTSATLPENWLNYTTLYNVLYYIGCIFGAVLGGLIADKLGRRASIFFSGFIFCIGTCMLVFSNSGNHILTLIARIIQGFGVGNSSFSIPIFGAEMAPKELRGMLSGFMQMTVVTGLLLAGIINYIVKDTHHGWRTTNAVAMAFPVILMIGIYFVPESPRWLYQRKGREAAETSLKRLRKTDNIGDELKAIGDALEEEGADEVTWKDVFHPSVRRRVFIAMALQFLQQASGINPVFTYGAQIFKDVLGDGIAILLLLQIINFLSTIPAMYYIDKTGRRGLLLLGAAGMTLGHLVFGIAFTAGCKGNDKDLGCSKTTGWIMIVATGFFIFNFAISWGPICWVYAAEIFPLKVRAKAVSLSSGANWTMGAAMVGIPKLFPYLHVNGVFFLFCALAALSGVFVYFYCPETRNLMLEDIEKLFNKNARGAEDVKTPDDLS
ncbi:unnamed protein product [Aphanomyces euteiches]|uniref:Hexose transporter 1 n=1 Tax=Aphanomyces euteiches TaxID=100861 RepID=A0A6G0XRK0_9STRA|nr:hypothetical protein Ae201684_002035 [Aphanomyces euteiches]KAH9087034.1 hypothetical protein Ae201684P_000448 [Aphanomyces euteiches]KAH9088657.1 hypothetical protein LEN26_019442 [Aphanomyces euteiches]KAH9111567.1 hypothetical protein AeMF1_013940 [Aphanomyces euteiches]KAH9152241.1 hypothetical protein AeRB84_005293 [Aphanomyces euteiches]